MRSHWLTSYGVAAGATLVATALRLVLAPLVGAALPFVTFLAAAILLAWYRGFWPAAFSILLSSVAGAHYVLGTRGSIFAAWGRSQRATVFGFLVISLILSFLIDFQRGTLARARSAEAALRRSYRELQRANRDLEIFAYSASHDLQEPLRTIAISAGIIRQNWSKKMRDDDPVFLSHILSAAKRMTALMEDLLAYTRSAKPEDGPPPGVDSGACWRMC
jgi:signal transduction histidine kinase